MSCHGTVRPVLAILPSAALALLLCLGGLTAARPALAADPVPTDPAPVAQPSPTPAAGPITIIPTIPDPKQWAADVFTQVLVSLLKGIADALRGLVGAVMGSSLNFVSQTPPSGSYQSPTVQALWGVVRDIANAALALVVLWGGYNVMASRQLGSPYHEAMEIFPRLILGGLLVNTSLTWTQFAIDLNNALCSAIGQATLPSWEQAGTGSQALIDIISVIIYLVTSLLVLLQMLMRLALVDVLLVAAPLGLVCWVLPQTQGWARLWTGTFFATVFTQFVQVLAMKLGASLIVEVAPMAPDAMLLSIFLGIAVLALTLKVPSLMRVVPGSVFGARLSDLTASPAPGSGSAGARSGGGGQAPAGGGRAGAAGGAGKAAAAGGA